MGHKIITEKDFWVCTSGMVPAQLQSTQLVTYKQSGEKYITVRDKATSSWIDFSCTKYILLAALAAVAIVAVAIVVGVITVATGGLGLLAIGALAGLAGGLIGAVAGALMCGQKMAPQREWLIPKSDFIILGAETITGDCTMTCPAGGIVKFAPNIKNWWQAAAVGGANFLIKMAESAGLGAMILPAAVPLLTGSAALAMPTFGSVWANVAGSFGGMFGAFRGVMALDQLPNQIATGESTGTMAKSALFGALPEVEFAHRILTTHELRPTDALLLLYFLNIKAKPAAEPTTAPKDEPNTPREEEPTRTNEEEPAKSEEETAAPIEEAPASENTGKKGEFDAYEDVLGKFEGDPARDFYGSGEDSHPAEWQEIISDLKANGVEIVPREGSLAYSPGKGEPGQMILDPDASYSALKHEYQHFLDDVANGRPGFGEYLQNQKLRAEMETNAYNKEIELANQQGNTELANELEILKQDEIDRIYGR